MIKFFVFFFPPERSTPGARVPPVCLEQGLFVKCVHICCAGPGCVCQLALCYGGKFRYFYRKDCNVVLDFNTLCVQDGQFVLDAAEYVSGALSSTDTGLQGRAAWSLGNLAEALVISKYVTNL